MKLLAVGFLISCLFVINTLSAHHPQIQRQKKEVLNNSSVIELVKLGLSEEVIIEKIRQSERNFDISLTGLKQLKAANVSDAIIREIVVGSNNASSTASAAPTVTPPAAPAAPLNEEGPGIYLETPKGLAEIYPSTFSSSSSGFLGTALTYGIKKSKMRAAIRGASANMVIPNTRPTFYFIFGETPGNQGSAISGFPTFGATSPAEFVLVKMERKGNSREAVLMEIGAFGSTTGTREKDIVDFSFEKVKPGAFRVTPKNTLDLGEYCFYYASSTGGYGLGGGKLYDFSVILPRM